jgi:hypothetical protein
VHFGVIMELRITNSMKILRRLSTAVVATCLAYACLRGPAVAAQALSNFNVKEAGINISYPTGWKVQEHPDKDSLVKFSGATGDGVAGEISVNAAKQFSGVSLETFAQMLQDVVASKLTSYHVTKQTTVYIGKQKNLKAICREANFSVGTLPIMQRYVIFVCADNFVTVSTISSPNQSEKLIALSNEVFDSITGSTGKQSDSHPSETASTSNSQFTDYTDKRVPVSFSYPRGWTSEEAEDLDHPAKIVGHYPDGSYAEISLYRGDSHPYVTMEQMLQELENRYYANSKDYRLVRQEPSAFGSGTAIQGIAEEVSFDYKGMKVKQCFVFFPCKDKVYLLSVLSPNLKDSELQALFHKVIATIRLTD